MGRRGAPRLIGLVASAALVAAACGSSSEIAPLSDEESRWCSVYGGPAVFDRAETLGLSEDLDAARDTAEAAADKIEAAGGSFEEELEAFEEVLFSDPAFIQACRSLYEDHQSGG